MGIPLRYSCVVPCVVLLMATLTFASDSGEEKTQTTLHVSSETEEASVWDSREGCLQVVDTGGRMAVSSSTTLRVGTWNIRWFPYGHNPDRARGSYETTDLPWLICTLAVQENLDTPAVRRTWQTVLKSLADDTGDVWQWTPQPCGKSKSHKIGLLWNSSRVTITQVKSLWQFNVRARSDQTPCEGRLRPGHYGYVQSRHESGADFHLIALHLKSGPTVSAVEARQRALNRIDQTVRQFLATDHDVVILGDFNTMGAGDNASRKSELKYVRRMVTKEKPGFQDLPLKPPCSHYFRGRGGWLDHIMVNTDMAEVHTKSARVTGYCVQSACRRIQGDYPAAYQRLSDHCPVVMTIENQDRD